ncbi:MAG: YgfZ/GcvT domain-containing protein [Gemmatimonadota bacterium]
MNTHFLMERSDRLRMTFDGAQAKAALNGLLTNEVTALVEGSGQYAAALTAKGRVLALCRVMDRGSDCLVDTEASAAEGFAAMIKKYVNPRLARYAVITDSTGCLGVRGDGAAAAIAVWGGVPIDVLDWLAPLGGCWITSGELRIWVVRARDTATRGFDCIGDRATIDALRETLLGAGWPMATAAQLLAERIEAGVPAFGVEMTDETIAQEACLDTLGAISFAKGCYTGQEVVARIHFRGHVNRLLRWVDSATALPVGAVLLNAEGAEVGEVRSSVVRANGEAIGIAMVRREVTPGTTLTVRDDASASVTVREIVPA